MAMGSSGPVTLSRGTHSLARSARSWKLLQSGLLPSLLLQLLPGCVQLKGQVGSGLSLFLQLSVQRCAPVAAALQLLQKAALFFLEAGPQCTHQRPLVGQLCPELALRLLLLLQPALHFPAARLQLLLFLLHL
ncbi:hypothetical protein AOLI_G00294100 [Acnodon oligacanthus]